MSTFTENYNLIKPDEADYYDVSDFNENMDAIDAQMALTEQETENISGKIGNSEDAETGSVFSKLNTIVENTSKAQSFIKSIQKVTYSNPKITTSATLNISPVIPAHCVVILERLMDFTSNGCAYVNYELTENTLNLTLGNYEQSFMVGFWIIEFY